MQQSINKGNSSGSTRHFLIILSVVAVLQAALLWGVLVLFEITDQALLSYCSLLAFLLVTGLMVYFAINGLNKGSHAKFSGFFMGGVGLKIILAGSLVLIAKSIYPQTGIPFLAVIAVIYLPLLILETYSLLRVTRKQ